MTQLVLDNWVIAPRFLKTFFMLNLSEHEIFPAHKCQNANKQLSAF